MKAPCQPREDVTRRFLKNLFGNVRTASKASEGKPFTRRAKLQMEGLEDRTVPTTFSVSGSVLGLGSMRSIN